MGNLKTNTGPGGQIEVYKKLLNKDGRGRIGFYMSDEISKGSFINLNNMLINAEEFFTGATCKKPCKLAVYGGMLVWANSIHTSYEATAVYLKVNDDITYCNFKQRPYKTINVGDTVVFETPVSGFVTLAVQLFDLGLL